MGIRTWFNRRSNSPIRPNRNRLKRPTLCTLEDRTVPATVGYYDMLAGHGVDSQIQPIVTAGHTPVQIVSLTAAELASIDVLFVQNPINAGYGTEYMTNLASIQAAVSAGMTLIIHDRYVDGAETILPDGSGFNIVRNFTDANNIQIVDNTTFVTNGPAGTLTNSSLDGGGFSDHGFAFAGSLPSGSQLILSTGDSTHIVTFSYVYGFGNVIYSSIPLDHYLATTTANPIAMRTVYAPNVIAYGVDLLNIDPVANPGSVTIDEDTSFQGQLSATDADGDQLTFSITTQPEHGSVQLINTTTGAYIYTYQSNFHGTDSFSFTVTDPRGGTSTATVTLTISSVNDPPIADPSSVTIDEDSPFQGSLVAIDVDGDPLTFSIGTPPQHGTVEILDASTGAYAYTPAANYHGADSFSFTVVDPFGGTSIATVSLTINSVNDAPVANTGSVTVDEDSSFQGQLSASEVDGDALVYSIFTQPQHGTVEILDASTGAYVYTPSANYNGADSFSFTATDPSGAASTAAVSIAVNAVNDPPTADAGPDVTLQVNQSGQFTATAFDVDGDALSYSWNFGDGTVLSGAAVTHGFASSGTYTVELTVNDGNGGIVTDTLTVTVEAVTSQLVIIGPTTGQIGKLLKFSAQFVAGAPTTPYKMTWHVISPSGNVFGNKVGDNFRFRPRKAGVYTVVCTVTDANGVIAVTSHEVTVGSILMALAANKKKGK